VTVFNNSESFIATTSMYTVLDAIATANPSLKITQAAAADFMLQLEGLSESTRSAIKVVYRRSGIDTRYTCIDDYQRQPADFSFYAPNATLAPVPTTADRSAYYQTHALDLAKQAAQRALEQADLAPDAITHLIVVSCTGFAAPGLDIHLVQQLGLSPSADRTIIGFMGCYAALNGLKTAHAICQSHSAARVMLVCVELCTLHFQMADTLEDVVVNAIFGDGAAAAILSTQTPEQAQGQLAYRDGSCLLTPNTLELMSWNIGNQGFQMELSPQVPDALVQYLPDYLTPFLQRHELTEADIDFWAIHPGGRQIVDKLQSILGLPDPMLADSYGVLRDYGNMSSPTILFVLQRILERHRQAQLTGQGFQNGIAMAFGPGLAIEGCLFQQVK
jgi:alpha-pyrone synthase